MHSTFVALTLWILGAMPPEPSRDPVGPQPTRVSPLKQTVDGIWKDAAIANETQYQQLVNQGDASAIAPRDMRRVIVDWPKPKQLRGWVQQMSVGFQDARVTVSWNGEVAGPDDAEAARVRFAEALRELGYKALPDDERKAFLKAGEAHMNERRAVSTRKIGETELFVSFEAQPYTGSSTYRSGVSFTWFARRAYRGPQPTLSEAFAALPAWMKTKYLSDKLFAAIADEPIFWLSSNRDFSINFSRPARDKLVAALEQDGFEYQREASPGRDGTIQKTWYRFSHMTFAHVIVPADGKTARFFCQAPQHQGDPIAVKPPPLHPSLRLPPEKRPVLTFDQLRFSDGEIGRQAKLFHNLAEGLAGKDWHIEHYKDRRYSADPYFVANWQSSPVTSTSYGPQVRPYRGLGISLQGKHSSGADELNLLHVSGASAPVEGWGAFVNYSVHVGPDGSRRTTLMSTAGVAQKGNAFTLDLGSGYKTILLTQRYVAAHVNESRDFNYRFQAQLPEKSFENSQRMLYGTPEMLRDEALADLDALRKHAREQLAGGTSLVVFDMTNVRSDNPPREEPAARHPPSDKTRQALWDAVEKQLAAQEASVRESFREIHAAVQKALPLADLGGKLLAP